MRLEPASPLPPPGLEELLADLADGENGFMGTPVHSGEATPDEYLKECCDFTEAAKVPPGWVPQTVFWVLDEDGDAVGMVRMRHYLNDKLLVHGGHIGFYIRKDHRGHGYATEALRSVLVELAALGEKRALLTVDSDNDASIRAIEAAGGRCENTATDPETGQESMLFWVELAPRGGPHA